VARLLGKDVTVMSPGGNILALWESCVINIERNLVDMTAVADTSRQYADGHYNWTVECSKLVNTSRTFPDLLLTGGTVAVSITEATTGKAYTGVARIARVSADLGGVDTRQMENMTLQGEGALTVT